MVFVFIVHLLAAVQGDVSLKLLTFFDPQWRLSWKIKFLTNQQPVYNASFWM